jgi:cyclohexanecarboxylate-CoA ligase/acyl-CoA synthetase
VPHAYQDFLANARLSAAELALGPDDVILSAAPFTHLYGLFTVNMALAVGATIALLPAFSPPALADTIRTLRPTAAFTAPAHIAACLNGGLFDGLDMTCLKFVQISGSAVPPALGRALEPRLGGGKVMQLWGMTELQAGAFTRPGDPEPVRLETTGRASPGTELRVVETDGAELPAGSEGELQMRGPSLFAGYLDNPQATRDAFAEGGWFRTGDLAVIDTAGNVRLTGRVKEIINRGGVKFNPLDVEALLLRHPAVAEVAVAPIPDPVLGEKACCFVVTRPGNAFTLEDMRNFLATEGVGKVKWPERLEIVAAMPLTPTRKIIKGELVRQLLARI